MPKTDEEKAAEAAKKAAAEKKAEEAAAASRRLDPVYDVFERVELWKRTALPEAVGIGAQEDDPLKFNYSPVQAWVLIAPEIRAPNRKAAIKEAVKDRPEEEQYGMFGTAARGEFKPQPKRKNVIIEDDWDPADDGAES